MSFDSDQKASSLNNGKEAWFSGSDLDAVANRLVQHLILTA